MESFHLLATLGVTLLLLLAVNPGEVSGKRHFKHDYINCRPGYMVQYKMTVHTLWSKETFPRMYPLYRPHAQWSTLVGRSHGPGYVMWEEGVNATKPVKMFAEEGDSKYLDTESRQGYGDVLDTFTAPPVHRGVGSTSAMVSLDGDHTQVSFVMRIIPSPDWFIGLSSEDLCLEGRWRNQVYADLRPMDTGTDQGLTFTAPNWPHEPFQPISEITNMNPSHPASSFYYPDLEKLPQLAYVELELLSQYRLRRTFSEIVDDSEDSTEEESDESSDESSEEEEEEEDSEKDSDLETRTPNFVDSTTTEEMVRTSYGSAEVATPAFAELTTSHHRGGSRGSDYRTGSGYSTSTAKAVRSLYGASHRTSQRDAARESTTSRMGFIMPRMSVNVKPTSARMGPRGKLYARDGEPKSDVSVRSFAEPQFVEVSDDLPSPTKAKVTHCEVTEWTEWTPCSQTCGFGKRQRSRDVLSLPSNGGANCPRLRMESLCGSMRSCKWNHFSFLNKDPPKRRRGHGRRGFRRN